MPLVISRANIPADLPAIIPPMISTFYSPPSCVPYAQALWGDPSPRAQRLARQRFDHEVVEDPTGFWLKCVDTDAKPGDFRDERFEPAGDTSNGVNGDANGAAKVAEGAHEGVVVGISHWKLYPQWIDKIAAPWDVNVDYYADDQPEKKQAEETLRTLPEVTNRAVAKFAKDGQKGEPHVRLAILFVHPKYQRRGIGQLLTERGLPIADSMGLPTWVEASMAGHEMYRRCGFIDVEEGYLKTGNWEIELRLLRRPPTKKEEADKTRLGQAVVVKEGVEGQGQS